MHIAVSDVVIEIHTLWRKMKYLAYFKLMSFINGPQISPSYVLTTSIPGWKFCTYLWKPKLLMERHKTPQVYFGWDERLGTAWNKIENYCNEKSIF